MPDRPHPVDLHVGRRLKLRRSLKGMSQERLGELLGLTFQQVQKYERGANRIGSSRLFEIAKVLDAPVEWFFAGAEAPPRLPVPIENGDGLAQSLAEAAQPFTPDGPILPAPIESTPVRTREALEMVRAFNRIADPLVRRRLFELTKTLAALRYR